MKKVPSKAEVIPGPVLPHKSLNCTLNQTTLTVGQELQLKCDLNGIEAKADTIV